MRTEYERSRLGFFVLVLNAAVLDLAGCFRLFANTPSAMITGTCGQMSVATQTTTGSRVNDRMH